MKTLKELDYKLSKRILDFLDMQLKLQKSLSSHSCQVYTVYTKQGGLGILSFKARSKTEAVWNVLSHKEFYWPQYNVNRAYYSIVENPFYKKSLDEIKIMLDFG